MFCSNCGKQIPDNTNFCNYCGAQQPAGNSAETVSDVKANLNTVGTSGINQEKQPKKKANIIVTLVVVLCAFLIGRFIIAPLIQPKPDPVPDPVPDPINTADYEDVFDGTYIVHFQPMFNMDTASFALKQADGIVYCSDYGYEDDIVKQWIETVYVPVSGYSDAQKAELENTYRTEFAGVDALNCVSVTYNMSENYLTVTCTYSDVDKEENYTELYNAGILGENTFISMSATEDGILNQGFAKKQGG